MSALIHLKSMGLSVSVKADGQLSIRGLANLPEGEARQAAEYAREHKAELFEELIESMMRRICEIVSEAEELWGRMPDAKIGVKGMLTKHFGVVNAPTGAGKTVVALAQKPHIMKGSI